MKPPANTVERRLRAVLRDPKYSDGLTVSSLAIIAGTRDDTTQVILNRMPDSYIDRWTKVRAGPGRYAAVWCVVVPPENCPPPTKG